MEKAIIILELFVFVLFLIVLFFRGGGNEGPSAPSVCIVCEPSRVPYHASHGLAFPKCTASRCDLTTASKRLSPSSPQHVTSAGLRELTFTLKHLSYKKKEFETKCLCETPCLGGVTRGHRVKITKRPE